MNFRHRIRNLIADLLYAAELAHPRRMSRQSLTILTFHRVLTENQIQNYPLPGLAVTPEFLSELAAYLTDHFRCVTVANGMKDLVDGGRSEKPAIAVTFDDGRMDNFEHAVPILDRYGIPATFYIPAAFVGSDELLWHDAVAYAVARLIDQKEFGVLQNITECSASRTVAAEAAYQAANFVKPLQEDERISVVSELQAAAGPLRLPEWEGSMGWLELNELLDRGHEIGSHTMTHAVLGGDCCTDPAYEISCSRELLEQKLRVPVTSFSYPTGAFDEQTRTLVKDSGYLSAVTVKPGSNTILTHPLSLFRFDVQQALNQKPGGQLCPSVFIARICGLLGAK